jgi:hypothetical protein
MYRPEWQSQAGRLNNDTPVGGCQLYTNTRLHTPTALLEVTHPYLRLHQAWGLLHHCQSSHGCLQGCT